MGCIYRIVCHATRRSYIGQTSYSQPFTRFLEHQSNAQKGDEGALYADMRLHGIHHFECICICVVPNSMLNDLECYYAEQYDAYVSCGGYNVAECGGAMVRREMSDDRRLHMKHSSIFRNVYRKK